MVTLINPYDFSTKRCVYRKENYKGVPTFCETYIYVMDKRGYVLDAVVALVHQIPNIGEEVIYVKDSERGSATQPAKVITKAEYETWHAFVKS